MLDPLAGGSFECFKVSARLLFQDNRLAWRVGFPSLELSVYALDDGSSFDHFFRKTPPVMHLKIGRSSYSLPVQLLKTWTSCFGCALWIQQPLSMVLWVSAIDQQFSFLKVWLENQHTQIIQGG